LNIVDLDHETHRLKALKDLEIFDSGQDDRFDRLVRIAQRVFNVPVVRISFINEDTVWFKAKVGMEAQSAPRKIAICSAVIQESEALVVPDLSQDPRFADSPQVRGNPHFRFYAGVPVRVDQDLAVGTFCLMDYSPNHKFSAQDRELLEDFSAMVSEELVKYRSLRSLQSHSEDSRDSLASAEERFFLATETSSDAIWDWDIISGQHFFSSQFSDLTGFSITELTELGLTAWNQVLDHKSLAKFLPLLEEIRRGERSTFQIETQFLKREGNAVSAILDARAGKLIDGAPVRLILAVRDISKMRQLQSQLQLSTKVDAVAQYNASLAHDCNNIAAVLNGQLELVKADIVDTEMIIRNLGSAENKLKMVVNRLRAISQNLQYTEATIAAEEFMREYMSRLDQLLPPFREVVSKIGEDLGSIKIDYWLIDNALNNIVFNSLESSDQGSIEIEVNQTALEEGAIEDLSPGRYLEISVEDRGCGMSTEVLAKAFEPFFSTKGEAPPRGMGLTIAAATVERAGGKIQITSVESQGTTVRIFLPQCDNAEILDD